MRISFSRRQVAACLLAALCWGLLPAGSYAADSTARPPQYDVLEGEMSRADLFQDMTGPQGLDASGRGHFALKTPFKFPGDAQLDGNAVRANALFGIDISHYTGNLPLDTLADKKVLFVYAKASDGLRGKSGRLSVDGAFRTWWTGLGRLQGSQRVYRGAYHFLRADVPAEDQARVLLDQIAAVGGIRPSDLPPAIDLEPDYRCGSEGTPATDYCWYVAPAGAPERKVKLKKCRASADERCPAYYDFWRDRRPEEILAMVNGIAATLSARFPGRTPLVYTSSSWWRGVMGKDVGFDRLHDLRLWVADYGSSDPNQPTGALHDEKPRTPGDTRWVLWQFTEKAVFARGYSGTLDANIYKGSLDQFRRDLGVAALD